MSTTIIKGKKITGEELEALISKLGGLHIAQSASRYEEAVNRGNVIFFPLIIVVDIDYSSFFT